ncbi:MAG: acyl carrier protein, partial [Comamonadaceae bacterium]
MSSLPALQALIQEKYGEEMAGLDPDTSMREKGFDSLALVEFVFAIEDHFHIVLPDDDPDIDTLAQLSASTRSTTAD